MTDRAAALLAWYGAGHRRFPWRGTSDPWSILVSEVMLQQTQAVRVVPFYERFIERFPTAGSLAAAPLADALRLWQGLGYPSRAKRLHESARVIADRGWPEDLTTLPGVGPYTAAAVGSFAFGQDIAVVDTNVRRILSRWHGEPLEGMRLQAAAADALTPPASRWNQAMMELGATLCRPRAPLCDDCPVAAVCTDPTVYEPPPRQAPYRGSRREARGKVLATLVEHGPLPMSELAVRSELPESTMEALVTDLAADGLLEQHHRVIDLPRIDRPEARFDQPIP